ncbi:MAG TPA: hypothetical protein VGR07_06655 [Thermoanaerobaculia bacterium]|jgi:hypothetical protein|nr:hypothetical protein [Thermoanaerobaculia bacterium]
MNRSPFLAAALVLMISLAGCNGRSPSESAGADSVSISSISPAAGTRLAPGSTVTFTARIDYELSSTLTGAITLVIEDQLNQVLTTHPQVRTSVTRGRGSVSLSDQITVPASGVTTVRVFFPLSMEGVSSTSVVASVSYPVGP